MIKECGTNTIYTDRLILRKFSFNDVKDVYENWAADEKVQFMYLEPVYKTESEVQGLLEKYISGYDSPYYYRWAIALKDDNRCIGQIAYFLVDSKNCMGEIEYCIGRQFQGLGYATEACKALVIYGFEDIHFHRVQIRCKEINQPSEKVIRKCKFNYEGTLKDGILLHNNQYTGIKNFSLLEQDYYSGFYCK